MPGMNPRIRDWARRLGLTPASVAELDALLEEGPAAPTRAPAALGQRYERLALLGTGSMGEVWRVRDPDLKRTMAMKLLHPGLMNHPRVLPRFVEEAQCAAQLQHPGIASVHELGRLPSGQLYFTMAEIRGRTLGEVIGEVHQASPAGPWRVAPSGWTFRRLVDALHRVCETVAFAHARGVIHRDLKPDNVMLGDHGEVTVVDWGLAKVLGGAGASEALDPQETVVTDRSSDSAQATRLGSIAGTPAYMPPEQARGQVQRIDTRSDVYGLGAILYHLLAGHPPFHGHSARDVLAQVIGGPPRPLAAACEGTGTGRFPPMLVAACERAMARVQGDRFADAGALASEIAAYLDGARRREQALEQTAQATALAPRIIALRRQVHALRERAETLHASVGPGEPESLRVPAWSAEDEADEVAREAALCELAAEQALYAALRIEPDLPEAHELLLQRALTEHAAARADRDVLRASRAEGAVARHAVALPPAHPTRRRGEAWLRGAGALSLVTDPPGAEVTLFRFEHQHRRLVPVSVGLLGRTPLEAVPVPRGSYLARLALPGHHTVDYPFQLDRLEHWDGVRPGSEQPHPVVLPRLGELGEDDCYLPAGWCRVGGDHEIQNRRPAERVWVDGCVVRRHPVTNAEYLRFLDDLVDQGREADALRLAPRVAAARRNTQGPLLLGRDARGHFLLVEDAEGDRWRPDAPVLMVDWAGAASWCRWFAQRTGRPWRLPAAHEWEKAARGVDGRRLPWGDADVPGRACERQAFPGRPQPAPVGDFPGDVSVYGVRGLAGNAQDWCADAHDEAFRTTHEGRALLPPPADPLDPARRVYRGGWWSGGFLAMRCAGWRSTLPNYRNATVGFRAARSLPGESACGD